MVDRKSINENHGDWDCQYEKKEKTPEGIGENCIRQSTDIKSEQLKSKRN